MQLQATLEPGQAISVLNDRVRQVGRLNSDIADWLQVRRLRVAPHRPDECSYKAGTKEARGTILCRFAQACKAISAW